MKKSFPLLNQQVISCTRCPRLVAYRAVAPSSKSVQNEPHWRKPVPGYGDPNARLLILGLAPAGQGANRTGRVFTGDASSVFLVGALYEAGFANQPLSVDACDGLRYSDCYLTAAVKCVPPKHHPLPEEFANCSSYFENEFFLLRNLKAVLALGNLAYMAYLRFLKRKGVETDAPLFKHGLKQDFPGWPTVFASYHPSPQNTNTKKLTAQMFLDLLNRIKKEISEDS